MTRRFVTFFLLATFFVCGAFAQVTTSVIIRTPTPASLAEWQRDRSLFRIILFNPSGAPEYRDARIGFIVREAGSSKIIAQSQDNSAAIPPFTIPAGASTTIRTGADIFNEQSINVDVSLRSIVATTNSLPEGNYEFCVKVFDSKNNEIGAGGELCRQFSILIPDPPSLILPTNDATLPRATFPIFSWTPVQTLGSPIRFALKIVPVFDGQTPRAAIDGNPILFEKFGISGVSYQYSPAQPQFSLYPDATGFAWQIQALDIQNKPATRNDGKSEIFTFRFDKLTPDGGEIGWHNGNLSSGGGTNIGIGSNNGNGSKSTQTQAGNTYTGIGISSISIGQFTLRLDKSITCKGECLIEGNGKIYVDFLRDSIPVRFSGITIRRSIQGAIAVSGEIAAQLPIAKRLRLNNVEMEINSLRWNPESAFFSGDFAVDWSDIGLGGGIGRTRIENAIITPSEIPWQTIRTALYRNGRDIGFGECLTLNFDSLNFAVSSQKGFVAALRGEALLPCIANSDGAVRGRFTISLDKPDATNLLISLQSSVRDVPLPGVPISFSSEKLLLDLSSEANFAALATPNSCLYSENWSNPLWRGIIIPNGRFALAADAEPIVFSAQNALLEPVQSGLILSLKSVEARRQRAKLGGFWFDFDTVAVEICRQTPQHTKLSGKISLPESLKLPTSAVNFDKITASLTADERWNWRGIIEARPRSSLTFGEYGTVEFSRGTVSLLNADKSVIEWTESYLSPANADEPISMAGLKIIADGTVKFGQNGWESIAPATTSEITGLPIAATEIGFGYGDDGWWFGISGTIQVPAESGLSSRGGIRIKRLRIAGDEKNTLTSDEANQTISVGKSLDLNGNFHIGVIPDVGFGLVGRPDATFHSIGDAKLTVDFALGKKNEKLFWYATGTAVFSEPQKFAQTFSIFGGAFGAGWNTALSHCDSSAIENTGIIYPPQTKFNETPLSIRAGLLLGESSRRLVRLAATVINPAGVTPGTLKNYLEISGNVLIHPELGFASGYIYGQLTSPNMPLRMTGTADLNLGIAAFKDVGFSVASGTNTPIIKFNGINGRLTLFEKFNKYDKISLSAAMQCDVRNAMMTVSADDAKFDGTIKALLVSGGINSSGSTGYIVAESETAPCLRLLFTQNNTSAAIDFSAFFKYEGSSLAGLDALPCAGTLSVASAGSVAERHRRDDGTWEFQPIVSSSDCGVATMPVFANTSAAIRYNAQAEIRENTLHTAGNQSASISFPAWSAGLAAETPNVKITASFANNSWEFEQNAPSFRSCDDIAAARAGATENCDLAPIIAGGVYSIRNVGTNVVAKGSRIAISAILEANGKRTTTDTIIELDRDLLPQSEYAAEMKNYMAKANKISGATLSLRAIAPLFDINSRNDCISIGSLTCPK